GSLVWLVIVVIGYLLSLLAKPVGLFLPLVLLLADFWPFNRFSTRAVVEKIPLFLLMLAAGYVAHQSQERSSGLTENIAASDPVRAALIVCYNLSFYLAKSVLPLSLSPFYAIPREADIHLLTPSFGLGVLGFVCFTAINVWAWRSGRRPIWVCLLSFALIVAPALGPIRFMGTIAADRFAYLPMIALIVLL